MTDEERGEIDGEKVLLVLFAIIIVPFFLWHIFTSWMHILFPFFFILSPPWVMGANIFNLVEGIKSSRQERLEIGLDEYSSEEVGGFLALGSCLAFFLFLYGIPKAFIGLGLKAISSHGFWEQYYAFIDWFLSLVNMATFLNLKATSKDILTLRPEPVQILVWAETVILTPWLYWRCVCSRNEAQRIETEEEERLKQEQEKEAQFAAWREKEKRKRIIEAQKEKERDAKEREIIEKQEEEAKDPDPWDSGFL